MPTQWKADLYPPEPPVAAGKERAAYLQKARSFRRTKGRTDWRTIKASSRFRQSKPYGAHGTVSRLPQEAIDFLLRPRHSRLTVTPNEEPKSFPLFVRVTGKRASVTRSFTKPTKRTDGLKVVGTLERHPDRLCAWRATAENARAPVPTKPRMTIEEVIARENHVEASPGRDDT